MSVHQSHGKGNEPMTPLHARAVRRMGELLKQFDAQGRRSDQLKEGTLQKLTQGEVAQSAGISEHQRKQAVRVASVPQEKFEAAVEAEKPRNGRSARQDACARATRAMIGEVQRRRAGNVNFKLLWSVAF